MAAKRIPDLTALSGAGSSNDDNLVIFDTSTNETKRILRSQLAEGLVSDLPYAGSSGSSLVGFSQAGTGAVARTVQSKLRETVSVKDFGAVGDGVADDTAAIIAAITYAQSQTSAFVYWSKYVIVQFETGKAYKVTGNNPLGTQYPDNNPVRYGLDLNGAQIRWYPSANTDVLFDRMANVYGFYMANGSVALYNPNTTPQGIFMASKGTGLITSYWSSFVIQNINVEGQNGRWETIFDITGPVMNDTTNVNDCTFIGFQTLFNCLGGEAVEWSFNNCHTVVNVPNHSIFKFLAANWSGGFSFTGDLICTTGGKVVEYKSSVNNATVGNVYIRARCEFRQQTTVVDANNGNIVIDNTNLFAGSAPATNINAIVDYAAIVTFRNSLVYTNYTFVARPASEITTFAVHRRGCVNLENCIQGVYRPTIKYVDSSGSTLTYDYVIRNGLVTPILQSTGGTYGFKGTLGTPIQLEYLNNRITTTYTDTPLGGGGLGRPYLISTGSGFPVQQNMLINSIKVTWISVNSAIISHLGILIDTQTTPDALLQWSVSSATRAEYEAIPTSKFGISYLSSDAAALTKRIYFAGLEVATGNWVKINSIQGWAAITLVPIMNLSQIPPTDNTIALV